MSGNDEVVEATVSGAATDPWYHRTWFYWIVAIAVILLLSGVILAIWRRPVQDAEAKKKAEELYDLAIAEGFRLPPKQQAVEDFERMFGTDGGTVAKTASSERARAGMIARVNRTGEMNQRSGIVDRRLLLFEWLVLRVYQPDKADSFMEFVDGLKTGDTIVE